MRCVGSAGMRQLLRARGLRSPTTLLTHHARAVSGGPLSTSSSPRSSLRPPEARKIVFLGPPGSGKGTYAKHCARMLGVPHVSTGDVLRSHIASGTGIGVKAQRHMERGALVPDDLIFGVLEPYLREEEEGGSGFILDGFPRSRSQAEELTQRCAIDYVINIRMREDYLIRKSLGRRVCSRCGVSYNVEHIDEGGFYMPALLPTAQSCIDDRCQDRFIQRQDDTMDVIRRRLQVFAEETGGAIEHFRDLPASASMRAHTHSTTLVQDVEILGGMERMTQIFEGALGLLPGAVEVASEDR